MTEARIREPWGEGDTVLIDVDGRRVLGVVAERPSGQLAVREIADSSALHRVPLARLLQLL